MSKGSISKKKNPTPEKGIRKMRKKKKKILSTTFCRNVFHLFPRQSSKASALHIGPLLAKIAYEIIHLLDYGQERRVTGE
jgi:hypothetical protein